MFVVAVVVAVLAALGWRVAPAAWTELQRGWSALFTTQEPSQQLSPISPPPEKPKPDKGKPAAKKPAKEPADVKPPAPAAAGSVARVQIARAEGDCAPGRICPVRVDVRFTGPGPAQAVTWSLRIVNRCSGKAVTRDGVSMTADAGWQQVYGISRPQLPKGKALAVFAVTKAPAKAASPPLLVPETRATC